MTTGSRAIRGPVAALALASALAGGAFADVVHLAGGGRLVGRVEETGDTVRVTLNGGTITLARSRVERIERSELPGERLAREIDALGADDVDRALALAAEAETANLPELSGRAIERAVAAAPEDAKVREAAYRWRVFLRKLPPDPAGDAKLVARFGANAKLHVTDHFRIAHDVDRWEVQQRAELLESAYRKVHELSAQLGIEALPIHRRLDVLLFADHARWLQAVGKDAATLRGVRGIHLVEEGRVFLFDTRTMPEAEEVRAATKEERDLLDRMKQEVALLDEDEKLVAQVSKDQHAVLPPDVSRQLEERRRIARRALDEQRARLAGFESDVETFLARENVASTTHEACHLVTVATGICRAGQPLWLVEGLATLFEVPNRASFVVGAVNQVRLADLRAAWAQERATTLADVVSDRVFTSRTPMDAAAYAEAWSLCHFLTRRHPEDFARYVRECKALPVSAQSADARLADFRRVFGEDLEALDRAWKDDVRLLGGR